MQSARIALGLLLSGVGLAQQYVISTVAGGAPPPTPIAAVNASIGRPFGVSSDAAGNVYFTSLHCVFKLGPSGILTRVAGNGRPGYSGDGGSATGAQLNYPEGVAVDNAGNLYIADLSNSRVRKVSSDGIVTTVAGNGAFGYSGDGGPATSAQLNYPSGVAVDSAGNLYIGDSNNSRVRKVSGNGIITTVAGNGTPSGYSGDGGPATSAQLGYLGLGVAVDGVGNLYIADSSNSRVREVSSSGIITTLAGTGTGGYSGDGGPATGAQLSYPSGVAVDSTGNLYISDTGNFLVRKVSPGGIIVTVASGAGNGGDGGAATSASFIPYGVAIDSGANLYIADGQDNSVRRVSSDGIITTVAGNRNRGSYSGDDGPATSAPLATPNGVTVGNGGDIYIADIENARVRKVSPSGIITTVAGGGNGGLGDGGPATSAFLGGPTGVAVDSTGNLYIADDGNSRVRKVLPSGIISTVAGGGNGGDGGPATSAQLFPWSVAVDSGGSLYISDSINNRVREVSSSGIITTVAGSGTSGYSGDGGPASNAQLASPTGVAVDSVGNLYIADQYNFRIRKVSPGGVITTVAGTGALGYSGDGGPATSAQLYLPAGVAVDSGGNLYIADQHNSRVRKVSPSGIITTIAGNGTSGYSGDGGPATSAQLYSPSGVAVDSTGDIYVSDSEENAVRLLQPSATSLLSIAKTHTGNLTQGQNGAIYTVTVSNGVSSGATLGTITVTETIPTGLTLTSMSGTGWNCSGNTCTRSDVLNPGGNYPDITATVDVASTAPAQLTNQVTVSGGGSTAATALDATTILSGPASGGPAISGVVNGADYVPGIQDGSWTAIFGSGLSATTRTWGSDDFVNGTLPTSLDGVSVTVDGLPAAIFYISPTQINLQVPATGKTGPVDVVVSNSLGKSNSFSADVSRSSPALFTFGQGGGRYPAALIARTDGGVDYLGPVGLYVSPFVTRPALPGEILLLYGTAFGPTNPPVQTGVIYSGAAPVIDPVSITIGGSDATVLFSGLVGAGLYQLNVTVPAVPAGDQPLSVKAGGVSAQSGLLISVAATAPVAVLSSLTLSSSAITGGAMVTGTIQLSGPAPSGGAVATLRSSGNSASVPTSVTIPAGLASVTFIVATSSVTSSQTVTVTATYNGASQTASLTINPVPVSLSSLSLSPTTVIGGFSAVGVVRLSSPAPSGGAVVALQSSGSAASVPASVSLAAGTSAVGFIVTTSAVTASETITITANLGPSSQTASLTVNPPAQTSPDLVVTRVTFPNSATAGSTQTFAAIVQNNGTATAGTFLVGLYYSTDSTITTGDTLVGTCNVNSLAAGASTTCSVSLTVPGSLSAGTYWGGAIADYLNQVAESNESNNSLATSSTVLVTQVQAASPWTSGAYTVDGNLAVDGQTVHVQVLTEYFQFTGDYFGSVTSQLDTPTVVLGITFQKSSASGNTITYSGPANGSSYTNLSRNFNTEPIVSGTMTLTLSTTGAGAAVNGTINFTTTARTLTATFTGTVSEID